MTYSMLSHSPDADVGELAGVTGWDVRTSAGERLGRVGDVVLGDDRRARYLDVESGGFFNPRRVLLPVDRVAVDDDTCVVRLASLSRQQFKNLPEWSGRPEDIGWLTENLIRRACDTSVSADAHEAPPDEWMAEQRAAAASERDDVRLATPERDATAAEPRRPERASRGEREARSRIDTPRAVALREAGERARMGVPRIPERAADMRSTEAQIPEPRPAESRPSESRSAELRPADARPFATGLDDLGGVRKRIETEHVKVPVRRMREEVIVERRPVSDVDAATARPVISGDEIRIPLLEEEIVVTRRQVVREEIVIRKRMVEETTEVEAELRRERVDLSPGAGAAAPSRDIPRDPFSDRGRPPGEARA